MFNKSKSGGFMDVIRCDEPSYLIWKWHPEGAETENNTRENAIRWGSSLRVKDGEVAVFVYNKDGSTMQEYFVGPFDKTIKTENFPILARIIGLAYDGGSPFQAEVYFINLARVIQVKFGVPFFDVYDPRFLDFGLPVAVRGTISFKITDYKEFVKLHRLYSFNLDEFQNQIRDAISRYVKDVVTNAPSANDIPVIQLESKIAQINDSVELYLGDRLKEDFGVSVSGIDISAIEIDKTSTGYMQLMAVTKNVAAATIEAQTEANIKNIQDKQRIEARNYEEILRIQREEGQYAWHKQTESANFAAFQVEKQTEVGVAGAEALGHMGENGAGGVDLGGNAGFNPAAMMAGMAVGGVVGQNIAGSMNNMMSGINGQGVTPPPIPGTMYHVAKNGNDVGVFSLQNITQMIIEGTVKKDTLVWKPGMSNWESAETVQELATFFAISGNNMTPPPVSPAK